MNDTQTFFKYCDSALTKEKLEFTRDQQTTPGHYKRPKTLPAIETETKTKTNNSIRLFKMHPTTMLCNSAAFLKTNNEDRAPKYFDAMVKQKGHQMQHHYRDHANEAADENKSSTKRKAKGGVTVPFPIRLHEMLDKIERDGLASIVSWQPHDRSFVVRKKKEFIENVLMTYFRQSDFKSFQRQLNRYGFSRITAGKDKGAYYHELFIRGKRFLSERMVRVPVKGTRVRACSSPETEPDFYSMPPVLTHLSIKNEEKTINGVAKANTSSSLNSSCNEVCSFMLFKSSSPHHQSNMENLVNHLNHNSDRKQTTKRTLMSTLVAKMTHQKVCSQPNKCRSNVSNDFNNTLSDSEMFLSWLEVSFLQGKSVDDFAELCLRINKIVPDNDPDFCSILNQLA